MGTVLYCTLLHLLLTVSYIIVLMLFRGLTVQLGRGLSGSTLQVSDGHTGWTGCSGAYGKHLSGRIN